MAMAQLASSTPPTSSDSSLNSTSSLSKPEIQALLGQFDAQINSMKDYPAKDTINALTKLAERVQFASDIVSFLETKIHRVNEPLHPARVSFYTPNVLVLLLSLSLSL